MQKALRVRTTVLPGGKIEIADRELPVGESVDVIVSQPSASERRSAWQVISEAPGQILFKSAKEVDDYLAEEKASWER